MNKKDRVVFLNGLTAKQYLNKLHKERKWYEYPRLWFYWYFWNYVSMWPLNIKSFFQRGFRGWADSDTWDFDRYLSQVIFGGIDYMLKKTIRNDKKYIEDLKIIRKTMRLAIEINETNECLGKEEWKKAEKEFNKGMKVFIKRYFQLWD